MQVFKMEGCRFCEIIKLDFGSHFPLNTIASDNPFHGHQVLCVNQQRIERGGGGGGGALWRWGGGGEVGGVGGDGPCSPFHFCPFFF